MSKGKLLDSHNYIIDLEYTLKKAHKALHVT
jgi:hypothetical protein